MAMSKQEVQEWLDSLPEDARIGVDDGGLCLTVVGDEDTWCEIGGIPLPEDESEGTNNGPDSKEPAAGG